MKTIHNIKTSHPLTADQVNSFVHDGFLVVPNLVSFEEIAELERDILRLARGFYPCEALQPVAEDLSDAQVLENILALHNAHYISPVMMQSVRHPQICGVLSQITAAHLAFWDGSVKCMQSMMFVKGPGNPGQAWHQDEIFIPTRDRSLIGAWIAIDDATIENGCLWVVPQSHQSGYLFPQRPHGSDEFDFAPESYGFDESLEIPVEVKSGSVVFFNGYLLHRSRKNRSQIYRRVVVNHYMNAYSLLPWSVEPGESVANADRRYVVPVSGVDPYAEKGIEHPLSWVGLRAR